MSAQHHPPSLPAGPTRKKTRAKSREKSPAPKADGQGPPRDAGPRPVAGGSQVTVAGGGDESGGAAERRISPPGVKDGIQGGARTRPGPALDHGPAISFREPRGQ
ncbi:hypothetical protein ID875_30165 [Streptomyces globisporus]|uniref:Uncharacterized protein n=1 Tax=Streptomyces globisporus TaxID=1908 RepID=A0A927BPY2_STRGL|nr:hypothetical protein [Streptomyces globisporus]